MKEEITRILKMVEEGKIDSTKASELIEALNGVKQEAIMVNNSEKMLKVRVVDEDDTVNVTLPLKFVKAMGGAVTKMPGMKEAEREGLDIKAILEAIDHGLEGKIVDIKSSDGSLVEVIIE